MNTVQFALAGGMYETLPHVSIPPGAATLGVNYEVRPEGGYRRVDGYERFDGRTSPSDATYYTLPFDTGSTEIEVGDTIDGATSGATGYVVRVELDSGTWAGGDAAGTLCYAALSGTFEDAENIEVSAVASAVSTDTPTLGVYEDDRYKTCMRAAYDYWRDLIGAVPGEGPIRGVAIFNGKVYAFRNAVGGASCVMFESSTGGWVSKKTGLAPGGSYEFVVHNFYGSGSSAALYGVSGTHKAFEWNGTTWTDITTGMSPDTPTHIAVHKNYLFLSFAGGSVQISPVADPKGTWSVVTGAGEIAVGDEVTALYSVRNDVLAIFTTNSVQLLYGTDTDTWSLKKNANQLGAFAGSVTEVDGGTVFMDARGVFLLEAVDAFGDFKAGALSMPIERTMIERAAGVVAVAMSRDKSLVRWFFGSKRGASMTFSGGKLRGWMVQDYAHQFTCAATGEDASGNELIVVGGDDGYVYRMDAGASFDSTEIASMLRLPFSNQKMPTRKKRYRKLTLDLESPQPFSAQLIADYNYGSEQADSGAAVQSGVTGGYWDNANWDEFSWDGAVVAQASKRIDGVALNISVSFAHEDDVDLPFTLQAVTLQFSPWGEQR